MEMVIRKNIVKLGKHILLFALVISSLAGCTPSDKATVEKSLEISLKNAEMIESKDSHGGFHGDGTFFCSLECPSDSVLNQIESNEHWHELPLSDNLNKLVIGETDGMTTYYPVFADEDGNILFPQVENGYYFFKDRYDEAEDEYDDADVLNRGSYNFTFALYDSDNHKLYYCEIDT